MTLKDWFLPARRYASAGMSYTALSMSFCHKSVGVLSERLNKSNCFFLHKGCFDLSYTAL